MGSGRTSSKQRILQAERQLKCLEMRRRGLDYQTIGDAMGITASSAYKATMNALRFTLQEPSDEVRKLELARLDRMLEIAFNRIDDGDLYAIDRGLAIMRRRADLLGLDAPKSIDLASKGEVAFKVVYDEVLGSPKE